MKVTQLLAYVVIRDLINVDLQRAVDIVQSAQEGTPCIVRGSEPQKELDVFVRIHFCDINVRNVWCWDRRDWHLSLFSNKGQILTAIVVGNFVVVGCIHVILDDRGIKVLHSTLAVTDDDTGFTILGERGLAEVDRGNQDFLTAIDDHELGVHERCGAIKFDIHSIDS